MFIVKTPKAKTVWQSEDGKAFEHFKDAVEENRFLEFYKLLSAQADISQEIQHRGLALQIFGFLKENFSHLEDIMRTSVKKPDSDG